ncbi:MAG: hypothetical protein GF308_10930 [Candidatus Heimdallarchaeota archaeon]|nr:hypothetical protein [Candidatus Heimdallarchaeota archaeon]
MSSDPQDEPQNRSSGNSSIEEKPKPKIPKSQILSERFKTMILIGGIVVVLIVILLATFL